MGRTKHHHHHHHQHDCTTLKLIKEADREADVATTTTTTTDDDAIPLSPFQSPLIEWLSFVSQTRHCGQKAIEIQPIKKINFSKAQIFSSLSLHR